LSLAETEIEKVMNMVGTAAATLKNRLEMIYKVKSDEAGRSFSGLHDTLLPMSSKTRSIFQQLRGSQSGARAKRSVKKGVKAASDQASGKISGSVHGSVTGVDLRHLLLLLPFLLFDLLDDEIHDHNEKNSGFELINPVHELIKLVLLLLEWYHLYR
jgi:hypothetical protein